MAGHQTRSRPPGNLARWVVLLVALVGLMAMHGLSDHGVGGPVAGSGAAAPMAGHDHGGGEGGGDHGSDHGGGHGGDGGMLAGLCLAVLVALLPFAAAAARTRLPRALAGGPRDRAAAVGTAIRARARGPGAPDLRMLSVQRC